MLCMQMDTDAEPLMPTLASGLNKPSTPQSKQMLKAEHKRARLISQKTLGRANGREHASTVLDDAVSGVLCWRMDKWKRHMSAMGKKYHERFALCLPSGVKKN
jgi:hypothetical protein